MDGGGVSSPVEKNEEEETLVTFLEVLTYTQRYTTWVHKLETEINTAMEMTENVAQPGFKPGYPDY